MNHSFNIELASLYGIEEAILIENIAFWIKKNVGLDKNFHDGCYWTYNSARGFHDFFPYMSEKKINRHLLKLENCGVILSGNYNKLSYDRTKWYAIIDTNICKLYSLPSYIPLDKNVQSIGLN